VRQRFPAVSSYSISYFPAALVGCLMTVHALNLAVCESCNHPKL
jgi:hypothetical protein